MRPYGVAAALQDALATFLKTVKKEIPTKKAIRAVVWQKPLHEEFEWVTLDFINGRMRATLMVIDGKALKLKTIESECTIRVDAPFCVRVHLPTFYELAKILSPERVDFTWWRTSSEGALLVTCGAARTRLYQRPIHPYFSGLWE